MNIKKRLKRLENEHCDKSKVNRGYWNLEKVSDEDLITLRNLTLFDPPKAKALQQQLVAKGILNYEYQIAN